MRFLVRFLCLDSGKIKIYSSYHTHLDHNGTFSKPKGVKIQFGAVTRGVRTPNREDFEHNHHLGGLMPVFGARTTLNEPLGGILRPGSLSKKSMLSSVPRPGVKWTLCLPKTGVRMIFQ